MTPDRQPYSTAYYRTQAWKDKRKAVLKRDNYTCRRCGKHGGRFEVHHTPEAYAMFGHERLEDLLTLCRDCHRQGEITRTEIARDRQASWELSVIKNVLVGLGRASFWVLKKIFVVFAFLFFILYTGFFFGLMILLTPVLAALAAIFGGIFSLYKVFSSRG